MRYFLLFLIILLVSCSKRELEPDIQIPQFEIISSKKIPITRDNQNMINSITVNNKTYNFVFNTSGNLISIN